MKILDDFEQGSAEWYAQRCGKVTMSRAKDLIARGQGKMRDSYVLELVAERLTGMQPETFQSIDMERGTYMEPSGVKAFEAETALSTQIVGFVELDERIGCSPDRLEGEKGGVEVKSPRIKRHLRNCFGDGMREYYPQVQGCMWVTGREYWHLVSWCPEFFYYPLHIEYVRRDEEMIAHIQAAAFSVAERVDYIVSEILAGGPMPEVLEIATKAHDSWCNVFSDDLEGATHVS